MREKNCKAISLIGLLVIGVCVFASANAAADCETGFVACRLGVPECVKSTQIKDGIFDCSDGSDEGCKEGSFVCKNKKECIDRSKVQDGVPDCKDGSDEVCEPLQHRCVCPPFRCVEPENVKDGINDCEDGSDEVDLTLDDCKKKVNGSTTIKRPKRRASDVSTRVDGPVTTSMFLETEILPNDQKHRPTGLLTSTVGTFIQQGTTTEFATKVFGTHVDGHYAKIVSTSSRVFFAVPSAAAGDALGVLKPTGLISSVTATKVSGLATTLITTDYYRTYIDGTYAQLVSSYSRVVEPSIHTVLATKAYNSAASGQIYPTVVHDSKQSVIEVSPINFKNENQIVPSKSSSIVKATAFAEEKTNTRVTFSSSKHSGEDENDNFINKIKRFDGFKISKPKTNLPTYTVGHYGTDLIDETTETIVSVDKSVEAYVNGKKKDNKNFVNSSRQRNIKGFKNFNVIHNKEDLLHVESTMPTVTYVGFDDFTTTVHNTVIVFMPHSKAQVRATKSLNPNIKVTSLSEIVVPTISSSKLAESRSSLFNKPRPAISKNYISATRTFNAISASSVPSLLNSRKEKEFNAEVKPATEIDLNKAEKKEIEASSTIEMEAATDVMSSLGIEPSITSIESSSEAASESITLKPTESIEFATKAVTRVADLEETSASTEEAPKTTTEQVESTTEGLATTQQQEDVLDESKENEVASVRKINSHPDEQIIVEGSASSATSSSTIQYVTKVIPNTIYRTYTYFTTFFIPSADKTSTSIKSNEVTSTEIKLSTSLVDIREILATAIAQQIVPTSSYTVVPSATVETTTESEIETTNNTPEVTMTETMTSENEIITTGPTTPMPDPDEEEIELLLKTQYTTYTYLTTYFQDKTSSISSREEVVTNIITSTLDKNSVFTDPAVAGLFARGDSIVEANSIAPTSVGVGRPTEDIYKDLHDAEVKPTARIVPDDIQSQSVRDEPEDLIKTYYTTYTYFTTLFDDNKTTINSRTEVYSNVVSPSSAVDKIQPTQVDNSIVPTLEVKATKVIASNDEEYAKKYKTMRAKEILSAEGEQLGVQTEEPIKVTIPVQLAPVEFTPDSIPTEAVPPKDEILEEKNKTLESKELDLHESIKSEMFDVPTNSVKEDDVPLKNEDNLVIGSEPGSLDDQISLESNTDIDPSPSLLLQTSYTTFTYFTTLYKGQTSEIVSRLETVTNVVTETVKPDESVKEAQETTTEIQNDLTTIQATEVYPITYFTTFTYWTTAYKDGSTLVSSREETVSNVVTPTKKQEDDLHTSQVNDEAAIIVTPTPAELEPTTFYTTYTYYTTSYIGESTVIKSRLETETNIVSPTPVDNALIPTQTGRAIGIAPPVQQLLDNAKQENLSEIESSIKPSDVQGDHSSLKNNEDQESSSQVITPELVSTTPPTVSVQPTGVVSRNVGSIVDVDGISTTYFETKAIGTYIGDLYAQVVESSTSVHIDSDRTPEPPVPSRTGLVRLIEGSIIKDSVTTAYESRVIGTIVDGFYAQIIESSSSIITATPTLSEIKETATPVLEPSHPQEEKQEEPEDDSKNRKPGFPRKNTITPVIRPFAAIGSRSRAVFQPKKRPVAPTTITRNSLTPTVTATPASASNSESSSKGFRFNQRRQSSAIANQVTNEIKPSSTRKFSRGRSTPTSSNFNPSASSVYNPSTGRRSSSRIQPSATSAFGSSSRRPAGFSGGSRSYSSSGRPNTASAASSIFPGSARTRIRPTSSLPFLTRSTTTLTTPDPEIRVNTLSESDATDEDITQTKITDTTKNEQRNTVTEATTFKRPLPFKLRTRNSSPKPLPTTDAPVAQRTTTGRKFPLRKNVVSDNNISEEKPTPRVRPTPRPALFKQRPTSNLFPPRGLFKRPGEDRDQNEENVDKQELHKNSEESDSEFESSEPIPKTVEPNKKVVIKPFSQRRRSKRSIEGMLFTNSSVDSESGHLDREKRQSSYGSFSSRRKSSAAATPSRKPAVELVEYEYIYDDEPVAPPPKPVRSRGRSNFKSASKQDVAPSPPSQKIRPSSVGRASPFTLTRQQQIEVPPSKTQFRRPLTGTRTRSDPRNIDSKLRVPRPRTIESTPSRNSNRRYNTLSNNNTPTPRRQTSRGRYRNDYESNESQYHTPAFDGTITITHKVPTEVTIPVINGKITEYKQVIRNTPSTQVLGPKEYSKTDYGGSTVFILNNEVTATPAPGVTEVTQFILKENPTTSVVFTPTTIRGRKTSFSHIIPSTAYEVEPIVNTINDALPSAPLANLLLSQLLLGNFGLQQNINPLLALNQQQVAATPTTEYKTKSTTYVTTVTEQKSTVIPITLRGKAIMTTIINSKEDVITATEYITETIVVTPTQNPNNQINSLLFPALLQAQLQQTVQPNQLLLQQAQLLQQQQLLKQVAQQGKVKQEEEHLELDDEEQKSSEFELISKEEISQAKPNTRATRPPKIFKQIEPEKHTSIITIYVSGKNPGEFSTVLSTVITDGASLVKREAISPPYIEVKPSIEAKPQIYPVDEDFNMFVMSAFNDIEGSELSSGTYETQSLESILGDVTKYHGSSKLSENFSTAIHSKSD